MLKRLDTLEVATSDVADAASTYEKNFGYSVARAADGASAIVKVGSSEIRLVGGDAAKAALRANGEGMMGLWLEAENIDDVAVSLKRAGIEPPAARHDGDRRVLAIDPKHANQVPLFIFDRKA
jgi:predicted enzyme related to lactoylglutathione lyase